MVESPIRNILSASCDRKAHTTKKSTPIRMKESNDLIVKFGIIKLL
jgi:hypothetical protein